MDKKSPRIGNIIRDGVSGQDTIGWNLYNKVTETRDVTDSNLMDFDYDGAGNRVAKYFTQLTDSGSNERNDYYVHDAQGNILAVYHETAAKEKMIQWVTYIHVYLITAGSTEPNYIAHFVAPVYGGNTTFTGSVLANPGVVLYGQ